MKLVFEHLVFVPRNKVFQSQNVPLWIVRSNLPAMQYPDGLLVSRSVQRHQGQGQLSAE